MKFVENRTGKKTMLYGTPKDMYDATNVCKSNCYNWINVLNIENYKDIEWHGIEFNRLFTKENKVYRFNEWAGNPRDINRAIEIEEIGFLTD